MSGRIAFCVLFTFVAMVAGTASGDERDAVGFASLAEYESVAAFEATLGEAQRDCLAGAGGGSMATRCFKLQALWDHELNIQYKKLLAVLDVSAKEELRESQRDWIAARDSTFTFGAYVDGVSYSSPGTMWIAMRAGAADRTFAAIVRSRTLLLRDWRERLIRGPITAESLLNE
jgi:uncharacterized protein YecT (DUF1311 family)